MEEVELISEKVFTTLLPLCEMNRQLVTNPLNYVENVVFQVGTLKLIDKAP